MRLFAFLPMRRLRDIAVPGNEEMADHLSHGDALYNRLYNRSVLERGDILHKYAVRQSMSLLTVILYKLPGLLPTQNARVYLHSDVSR